MKKLGMAILAAATLIASCTKMDVAYEQETEIGFAPATKNVTKAGAMAPGALGTDSDEILGVWAFWDEDGTVESNVSGTTNDIAYNHYPNYSTGYLNNAMFKGFNGTWAGWNGTAHTPYTWPLNGALVFAGYNVPAGQGTDYSVNYTLNDNTATTDVDETNTMKFTNYVQSTDVNNTFDLCWFERTAASYNYRATGTSVPVTLKHALSWLTFQIKGEGSAVSSWKITKMTLLNVATKGTGTCTTTAVWDVEESPQSNMVIYSDTDGQSITSSFASIGSTNGIVVIPQTPVELEIEYKYPKPQSTTYITETASVSLGTNIANNIWVGGTKYIYKITVKANEILIAPKYDDWGSAESNITVE